LIINVVFKKMPVSTLPLVAFHTKEIRKKHPCVNTCSHVKFPLQLTVTSDGNL